MVEWSCYHDPLRLRLCFDDLSPRETTPSLVKGSPAVFQSSLYVCVRLLFTPCLAVARRFRPSRRALRPPPCWGEGGAARTCESAARRRVFAPTKVLAFLVFPVYPCLVACPLLAPLSLLSRCSVLLLALSSPCLPFPRRSANSLLMPRSWRYFCRVEKCSLYVQAMC